MSNADKWLQAEPLIRQKVEELQQEKKNADGKTFLFGPLLGLVLVLFVSSVAGFHPLALIVCIAVGCIIVYCIQHHRINTEYKRIVVPQLVEVICPGATYHAEGDFPKELIKESDLYPAGWGEHYKNEDTIRGKVGSTDFQYGEMTLSHTQSNGKSTIEVIDFKGFAFEADFNKYFQGHTVLSSERLHLMGQVGLFSSMKHISLEDVVFNDHFRTYSSNDQEARYILTPALQQRILKMEETLRLEAEGRSLSMSFLGSRLLIMVQSSADRFEVKYDFESIRKDFISFCCLLDIIEMLNLNLRIWTKE